MIEATLRRACATTVQVKKTLSPLNQFFVPPVSRVAATHLTQGRPPATRLVQLGARRGVATCAPALAVRRMRTALSNSRPPLTPAL